MRTEQKKRAVPSDRRERDILDRDVVKAITRGSTTSGDIIAAIYGRQSPPSISEREIRAVDRSLQRLRKDGRIVYGKGRWSIYGA